MKKLAALAGAIVTSVCVYAQSPSLEWAKSMGGPLGDYGNSIAVSKSGSIYCVGSFQGTVDFDPDPTKKFNLTSSGSNNVFITKLDADGKFVWAKALTGTLSDYAYSIALDKQGNVYTAGAFFGTVDFDPGTGTAYASSMGGEDIFITKLDSSGNLLWVKTMGSSDDDKAVSITTDKSGNVYATGSFSGGTNFDPSSGSSYLYPSGASDIFVLKLNSSGSFVWVRQMGGSSSDYGAAIATDTSNNVYTSGYFWGTAQFGYASFTSAGNADMFISKQDSAGAFIWAKQMGGSSDDYQAGIAVDKKGNVYTTGRFNGTANFDPNGGTYNLTAAGGTDIFISKLDPYGNFAWAKQIGGTSNDNGASITLDTANNVYTTGYFNGKVDFDPGSATYNLGGSSTSNQVFISKINTAGNFVWAKSMGGNLDAEGSSIFVNTAGNVYTTGYFQGTVNFDPSGTGKLNLGAVGAADIFVHKMSQSSNPTAIQENITDNTISIYPNPTNGMVQIDLGTLTNNNIKIQVFNSLGQMLIDQKANAQQTVLNLQQYPTGIYFVKVMNENEIITHKAIVKQ